MLKQIFDDSSDEDKLLENIRILIECYECQSKAITLNNDYILIKIS